MCFRLIVRNVMAQFYRPLRTFEVKAEFTLLNEAFRARGQSILDPGWKPLFTTREDTPPLPTLTQGEDLPGARGRRRGEQKPARGALHRCQPDPQGDDEHRPLCK